MANPKNTKLDKDALKQPDEFLVLNTKLMTWIITHKFLVIAIIIIILVIGGGFSGMKYRAYTQELKVSALTDKAMQNYLTQTYAGADTAFSSTNAIFNEIFDKYGKTQNVGYAYMIHGNIAYQAKEYAAALASYKAALPRYASDPAIASNIENSLGHTYWALGDQNNALAAFQKVADNPGALLQDDALYSMGVIYAQQDNTTKSAESFDKVVTKYPDSLFAALLKSR